MKNFEHAIEIAKVTGLDVAQYNNAIGFWNIESPEVYGFWVNLESDIIHLSLEVNDDYVDGVNVNTIDDAKRFIEQHNKYDAKQVLNAIEMLLVD